MRDDIRFRAGSAFLGLLVLFNLGSGLVHPCCLGGAEIVTEAGAGIHPPTPHHGQDADLGGMSHQASMADDASAPAGHGHHPAGGETDGDGCDGVCGLCCQTLEQVVVASSPVPSIETVTSGHHEPAPLRAGPSFPQPDFLLPFANAPPGSPTLPG